MRYYNWSSLSAELKKINIRSHQKTDDILIEKLHKNKILEPFKKWKMNKKIKIN